jgi:nitrite reductase/ring-hydroxylating ferredoxin subunit
MKKIFFSILTIILLSGCTSNAVNNDILPVVQVNTTVDLSLPQFNNLQVPGGWAEVNGGLKGIIIYNINGDQFKAFERAAPHLQISDCSQMIVENNIRLKCPCDDSEFNILNGAPLTEGIKHSAREYFVNNLNGVVLRITNF